MDNSYKKNQTKNDTSQSDESLQPEEIDDEVFFSPSSLRNEVSRNTNFPNLNNPNHCKLPFPTKNYFKMEDFEILELLGRGSYAKVVKAKIIKNNMIVAIKIIYIPFIVKVFLSKVRKINYTKFILKTRF